MQNGAASGECWGQIVQKFMQESSNAKRCLGVEGVGRGLCGAPKKSILSSM